MEIDLSAFVLLTIFSVLRFINFINFKMIYLYYAFEKLLGTVASVVLHSEKKLMRLKFSKNLYIKQIRS